MIGWGKGSTMARAGINYLMVVHGEQRLTMHKPLPYAADVTFDERVVGVFDKGKDKGAVILMERVISEKGGDKLCTLVNTIFARGDGGFGGPKDGAPEPHQLPTRAPDLVHEGDTRAPTRRSSMRCRATAIRCIAIRRWRRWRAFRARSCTGCAPTAPPAARSFRTLCEYDATKIAGFDVRFSAPVFPGETIVTEMWKDGGIVSFRCKLKERDVVVINNGKCTLAG